jgi:hypothetical protein
MENRLQYRYHEKLYKEELINIFNEILENKPLLVLVLTLMILKAHINL